MQWQNQPMVITSGHTMIEVASPTLAPRLFRYSANTFLPLGSNPEHQFAAAHALSIYQTAAIYSFIPKNACSTLRFSIALANGCISREEQVNWIHLNNSTFRATLSELVTARYTFVILRDPFARLASCFLDKFVGKLPPAWRFHEALSYQISLDDLTFRQFVAQIGEILRADIHWRPQADFLVYEQYDDWFCVEKFDDMAAKLEQRIGLAAKDTRHLLRHGADQYRATASPSASFVDATIHEIAGLKRKGEIPSARDLYDEATARIVREVYAEDFSIYGDMIGGSLLFPHLR